MNLPHCVLVWHVCRDSKNLRFMRLVTPTEFYRDFDEVNFDEVNFSWNAYRPDGCTAGPSDQDFTKSVNRYGLESQILEVLSGSDCNIAAEVLQKLNVDLRRFRINGWDLNSDGWAANTAHRELIKNAVYVEE